MQAWRIVRTAELPWLPTRRDGICEKSLLHDPVRHRSARLIKMSPGAEIPSHRHHGTEESLVLEGTGAFGDFAFGPGDYHRARSGSLHSSYASKAGCVFLLFSGTEYEFHSEGLEQSSSEHFTTVRSRLGMWQPKRPGLDIQTLFLDSESGGEATILQRLAAGSSLTASQFSVSEAFILEGKAHLGSVELSVEGMDDGVQVEVHDTGAGIPPDQLPRIFEKFYQADNQRAAATSGSGLGLAIAKQIVEAHGGSILCDSTPGVGTTFSITLPVSAVRRHSAVHSPAHVKEIHEQPATASVGGPT